MSITGDYHTHTKYSHGSGFIEDNVLAAVQKNLKEVGIADHGLSHVMYGVRRKNIKKMRAETDELSARHNLKIYLGIESNINGAGGHIDISGKYRSDFDIILAGFHKFAMAHKFRDLFSLFYSSTHQTFFRRPTRNMLIRNTNAVVRAIIDNPVAILTHINYALAVDVKQVAQACADHGTLLELNGKRINLTPDQVGDILATPVQLIVSSDAHSPEKVGDFGKPLSFIYQNKIPLERIANWNKVPVFRTGK